MKVYSTAFEENKPIPETYTSDGHDVNPPLVIEDVPEDTQSLVLIVDDPDAPKKTWLHWLVYDIAKTSQIKEDTVPGTQGINDFKQLEYGGPAPPSGTHRYFFHLYALDSETGLDQGATREEVEKAMKGHVLEKAEVMGVYSK